MTYLSLKCSFPLFISGLLFLLPMFVHAQSAYSLDIEHDRLKKDLELRSKKTSPLQKSDRKRFHDLNYYPVDEQWKLKAAFQRSEGEEIIEMPTSAGTTKRFKAYGFLRFDIEGESFKLIAYKRIWPEGYQPANDHPSLFIPFKDLTTGEETYGGGRYMDIDIPASEEAAVELDFNKCYNPYCAYGGGFSCPVPPESNFIEKRVTAGEKAYAAGTH